MLVSNYLLAKHPLYPYNMLSNTLSIISAIEYLPAINGLLLNFLLIIDIIKNRLNSRGQRSRGKTIYTCTIYQDKQYNHKANATNHIRNNYPMAPRSPKSISGT